MASARAKSTLAHEGAVSDDRLWFVRRPGNVRPFRLYCFSYAGGNASAYLNWQESMPAHVEICAVQLPGRGARFGEPPIRSIPTLVESLAPLLQKTTDQPFAFFGHSLGALVAFESARRLAQSGAALPTHLFVSGCHAPRFRDRPKDYHLLDDDALIRVLEDYNGTPPEILADKELIGMLLPVIRADFALAETYRYTPSIPLAVPITAFAGHNEERDSIDQVTGWELETTKRFSHHWFEGDHFFIHGQRQRVLDHLVSQLNSFSVP